MDILHQKYMRRAIQEAKKALDSGDFPVGCVIADKDGVICAGQRRNSHEGNELDHAEIVALRSLYTEHKHRTVNDLTIYSTMEPCLMCFSTLILNNVKTIVYAYEDVMGGAANLNLQNLNPLYASMNIKIISNVLRDESLKLFQDFFQDEKNDYWKDSYLSRYTLSQQINT